MQWQAIGRIRRLGQESECHVWNMVTLGTLEEDMYVHPSFIRMVYTNYFCRYGAQAEYARAKHVRDDSILWDDVEPNDCILLEDVEGGNNGAAGGDNHGRANNADGGDNNDGGDNDDVIEID